MFKRMWIINYLINSQGHLNKIRMSQSGQTTTAKTVADSIPSSGIDFGYCGIHQTATKTFSLVSPHSQGIVRFEI